MYWQYAIPVHLLIRVVGTLAVLGLLSAPLLVPHWENSLLNEIHAVPFPGNLLVVAAFFGLVALYCRTLQTTMRRAGAERPASVWWMFAIPANFVEDFFIVQRVGAALDRRLARWPRASWSALGHGWCGFQIMSLLPGTVGVVAGAMAIVLWSTHWVLTLSINRGLR